MGLLFGRTPFYIKSGWLRFSYKSLPFVYALILAFANWFCLLYYIDHLHNTWNQTLGSNVSFSGVLFAILVFSQPFSTIFMVYSWAFEVPAIVRGYNSTAVLEEKISIVFPLYKQKPSKRNLVTFLIAFLFVVDLIIAYFLLKTRFTETPLILILLIIVNVVVTFSYCVLWCFNCYFISDLAVKLNKYMLQCLQVRENCAFKIKTCRKIWISVWKQSQMNSQSIAVSLSFALVLYGMIFVVGCYGILTSIRNQNILETLEMSPYVVVTFTIIACVFETSYQASHKLGATFLDTMIILDKDRVDHECVEEIDKFVDTINRTRIAAITLKDYMTMDRTLVVSFLSYSITYLIVLIQFQDKNEEPSVNISTPMRNNTL
uniref:Gustatory receptor n=1 Tax=Apolygus lucorum TaxID=248454 RepID=A0A1Q1NIQ0_APOLU|nr:olfactory receptor [Apolygus lucorum]